MSQEETMRLAATVVDRYSGPIREMQKALRKLSDDVKGTHASGVSQAKKHEEAFGTLNKEVGKFEERMKQGVMPTLAALGVTTLSVAGAVAALKDATTGFAETTRQLSFLSQETKLSIDQLRQFEALGRRIGVAPDAMGKSVSAFAQHMQNLRRMAPEELNAFRREWDANANEFLRSLSRLNNADALSGAVGFLDRIPSQQDKRKWLRMLGLPEDLAALPVAEIKKQIAEIREGIGTLGPDAQKSGLAFQEAINRLGDSVDKLKVSIGTELAGAFRDATEQIRAFVNENRDGLVAVLKSVSDQIGLTLKDVREIAGEFKKLKDGDYGGLVSVTAAPGSVADKAVSGYQAFDNYVRENSGLGSKLWNKLFGGSESPIGHASPISYRPGDESGGGIRRYGGGRFQMLAGAGSGDSREARDTIAAGTKTGVIEALRQWKVESDADRSGPGGGGGGGGGVGGGSPFGGGGGGGPGGGAGVVSGRSGANALASLGGFGGGRGGGGASAPMGGGTSSGASPDVGAGLQGSEYLQARRARFAEEMQKNPALREQVAGMISTEGERDPVPVVESLMNRMDMEGKSLNFGLRSGFYGPINRGQLPGAIAALRRDPKRMAHMNAAIDAALAGSNTIKGATDQGMFSDPNGRWTGGRVIRGGQVFNDWGGSHYGHGGHQGSQEFREMLQRGVAGDRAHLPNIGHAIGGGVAPRADQLGLGKQSSLTGSASVHVSFDNLPSGARTRTAFGGLFKQMTMNKGRAMVPASQEA